VFSSLTVSVLFTAVFVGTGGYALHRLTAQAFVDRAAEAAHLLMSLAMLAMTWGWTGGPGSPSGMVQVGLFGLFTLWFVAGAVGGSIPNGLHATNAAAMVWMVVAMPELMGMGTHTTWTAAVTVLFTALLVVTACVWIYRAVEARTDDAVPIADAAGAVAVVTAARRHVTARIDACCHALMSLGMGAMFLTML
jgi:Domain of unknown function (DUF5134)